MTIRGLSFALLTVIALLPGCTHGSMASSEQTALSRFARQDMCCAGITIGPADNGTDQAMVVGCGQRAYYRYASRKWTRVGDIGVGPASQETRMSDCSR